LRLLILERRRYTVATLGDDDRDSAPVLDFLREQPRHQQASARGFYPLFRRYAQLGRAGLTEDQFHLANQAEKIWEFRKGSLRVFGFEDDGALIVLTHGIVKKSQKAKASEIAVAARARDRYLAAKARGLLTHDEIDHDQPNRD
jgi:hypothetical protein